MLTESERRSIARAAWAGMRRGDSHVCRCPYCSRKIIVRRGFRGGMVALKPAAEPDRAATDKPGK